MDWINIFGLMIVILILLPNLIYFYKNKDKSIENKCKSKIANIAEQIGRYGSMFLMTFNIGLLEFGFRSNEEFAVWLVSNGALLLMYWVFWYFYFTGYRNIIAVMLAVIPSLIFISGGFFLRHWLLVIFGLIFSVSHIYITWKNAYTN